MTTTEPRATPTSGIFSQPRPPRVLLAEDDDDMRTLLAEELRRDGYDVLEARDGSEMELRLKSVRHAPLRSPDCVVMDVRMPGPSGLEILMELRKAQWSTHVVLITGFPEEPLIAQAEQLGAQVLGKPFDIDALRVAIRSPPRTAA